MQMSVVVAGRRPVGGQRGDSPSGFSDAVVEARTSGCFARRGRRRGGRERRRRTGAGSESTTSRIVIGRCYVAGGGGERAKRAKKDTPPRAASKGGEDVVAVFGAARGQDRAMERGDAGWSRRLGRAVDDTFAMAIVVGWNHIARARDVRLLSVRRSSLRARRSLLALARLVKHPCPIRCPTSGAGPLSCLDLPSLRVHHLHQRA